MQPYVYAYRGPEIENRHRVSLAVVNREGKLLAAGGDPRLLAHMRSSAKPFQAQALFQTGAMRRFGFGSEELALAISSHDGTPRHTEIAARMLERIGLDPSYLACGVHAPFSRAARRELQDHQQKPTVLHNNCSGKHSGMLAAAVALGADPHGYELPQHPVQQLIFQTVRELSGVSEIPYGVDGCSVPTFALPLDRAAWMFTQLAEPALAPQPYREGLEAAYSAMRQHPDLIAGPESIDTVLMQLVPGLAAKRGADGYYGMALRETKWGPIGITLKVEDGSVMAREPAVVQLLELLGVLDPSTPLEWRRPVIKNVKGLEVGYYQARLELVWS
ncbi:asparaginase [Allomeiothermus silvanus DSM 9946]|uniref:Asparaginase n=1 Tax=Allomeiothermus silvanus (strain ATCC 700542 / DSM 9946 / NBRC 106475 / NCIMB 13440 / VI-R2) TaxID=526227 RepID=D7BDN8_ALLS1|nr:asparaginase [Allomeiothermus silvanus]ADH64858.1 asparaginase [Allomeiothermus silvanus DSM 9946]